jgi:hypothetical protein
VGWASAFKTSVVIMSCVFNMIYVTLTLLA